MAIITSDQMHYTYLIRKGNNSKLIRSLMRRRWWWSEAGEEFHNFKWS